MDSVSDSQNKKTIKLAIFATIFTAIVVTCLLRIQPMNETGIDFIFSCIIFSMALAIPAGITATIAGKIKSTYIVPTFILSILTFTPLAILKEQQVSITGKYPRSYKECMIINSRNLPERFIPFVGSVCEKEFDRSID